MRPESRAFLSWNTVENTFGAGAGQPTPAIPVLQAGVTQAGGRQIVIDQNGHALYYAMHLNPAFVKFVNDAHLTSADQIRRADPGDSFHDQGSHRRDQRSLADHPRRQSTAGGDLHHDEGHGAHAQRRSGVGCRRA